MACMMVRGSWMAAALVIAGTTASGSEDGWERLLSSDMHLPTARTAQAPADDVVARSMHVRIAGRDRFHIDSPDGWNKAVPLPVLERWLIAFANRAGEEGETVRDEDGHSTRHLVIWADETTTWKEIGKLMFVCGRPGVAIAKVWLAASTEGDQTGVVPLPLPGEPPLGRMIEYLELKASRKVDLGALDREALERWRQRGWKDDELSLSLQGETLDGIARVAEVLTDLRERIPAPADDEQDDDVVFRVELSPNCAYVDLVRMVDTIRDAGFSTVHLRAPELHLESPSPGRSALGIGGGAGGFVPRSWGTGAGVQEAREAVDLGIDWLVRHQSDRGYWSSASFADHCEGDPCDGAGSEPLDVGVTGLSLLALIEAGNNVNHGAHKKAVRRAAKYLMDVQDEATGCFGVPNAHTTFLYDHGIATLAITEVYGRSKWPMLKEPAQRGIAFIQRARNRTGAWRYAYPPNGSNDMSVSGWMALALVQAKRYGLDVDPAALDGVRAFIDDMTDEVSGRTGYQKRGGPSDRSPEALQRWPDSKTEAMTALAIACRVALGESTDSDVLRHGAALLRAQPPSWSVEDGTIDYSYWYFGTRASMAIGGDHWRAWHEAAKAAVIGHQAKEGHARGSWGPEYDPWGVRGGRVYATAMMTLCLLEFRSRLR